MRYVDDIYCHEIFYSRSSIVAVSSTAAVTCLRTSLSEQRQCFFAPLTTSKVTAASYSEPRPDCHNYVDGDADQAAVDFIKAHAFTLD